MLKFQGQRVVCVVIFCGSAKYTNVSVNFQQCDNGISVVCIYIPLLIKYVTVKIQCYVLQCCKLHSAF